MKKWFTPRSAYQLATNELADAKRELLAAQSAQEYATQMVAYHQARIARLTAVVVPS